MGSSASTTTKRNWMGRADSDGDFIDGIAVFRTILSTTCTYYAHGLVPAAIRLSAQWPPGLATEVNTSRLQFITN